MAEVDANGAATGLKVEGEQHGEKVSATLPARTILAAAGTQPNTVLAREDVTHAFIDGISAQLRRRGRARDARAGLQAG